MSKIFIIQDEEISYVSEGDKSNLTLRYSDSDIWNSHIKGKTIATLKDSGNEIKLKINNKSFKLEYDEFVELFILAKIKLEADGDLMNKLTYLNNDK